MKPLADEMHDWLLRQLPIEEAENRHLYKGVPFGVDNAKWQELRTMVVNEPKMQLWYFCSSPKTWTGFPLCGMEGYAAVKDGKIVDFVLTAIS
jgi:hypothetical protein